ncbi:uncharacterized protein EDB93DRAFT_824473 [Suillus bovinus]|uniref:uncharacterized protein n=1 Tax=Suillus bovinus TaxID=48563 RepID=UPI001B881184|nr:uncharacterized protein EDB93DRAFT_824473 [Suillus bovinus]KAG2135348.1 hypothetical protein EDB93DRAFT_824473 [Suillus bovinus]
MLHHIDCKKPPRSLKLQGAKFPRFFFPTMYHVLLMLGPLHDAVHASSLVAYRYQPSYATTPSHILHRTNEPDIQYRSHPLSWTGNIPSGLMRRRDRSDIELREPPVVEVPCAASKLVCLPSIVLAERQLDAGLNFLNTKLYYILRLNDCQV